MLKTSPSFKPSSRIGRGVPTEYFVLANVRHQGAVIGQVGDLLIHEIVTDGSGRHYRFAGVAPRHLDGRLDVEALRPGEWIVLPGLVYHMEEERAPAHA